MREMKRDLDAARAPKVDQNLYYGMYYRFLDYSKRALSRIGEVSVATIYLPFPLLCVQIVKNVDVPFDHLSIQTHFSHYMERFNCISLIVSSVRSSSVHHGLLNTSQFSKFFQFGTIYIHNSLSFSV